MAVNPMQVPRQFQEYHTVINRNFWGKLYFSPCDLIQYLGQVDMHHLAQTSQGLLRKLAAHNQKGRDPFTGYVLEDTAELHHALITKGDVMSNPDRWQIHHSYNVIMVNHHTHQYSGLAHDRQECAKSLTQVYGHEYVRDWYNNFPARNLPSLFSS